MCIDLLFYFLLQTPESHIGQAAKGVSYISASGQLNKAARRRICGDHHDSPLPLLSQESTPNPNNAQDLTLPLLTESLRSYDFYPDADNDHAKSHKHQVHSRFRFITLFLKYDSFKVVYFVF